MDIQIRTVREDEFEAFAQAMEAAFSNRYGPAEIERERAVAELDRCHAAFDRDEVVAGTSAMSFTMAIPGGAMRVAGITGVGVKATHRRRGINTALMRAQLDDVRERGETVAVLHASEGGIYGRYGYGLASHLCEMRMDAERSAYIRGYEPRGRVRMLEREAAFGVMRSIYERVWRSRPGMLELDEARFAWMLHEHHEGADGPWYVVHEAEDGAPDAFAVYKVKDVWRDRLPRLELKVRALQALTPQAYADMWRYLFDVDLVTTVSDGHRPIDEPLLLLLREPRRLRFRVRDGLYARLVDVPTALAARGYGGHGRVIFEVRDLFCPWNEGRYALEVGPDGVLCESTEAEPDLVCSVNDLGSAFLGGFTFGHMASAGLVLEVSPGALVTADAMFASAPAPWCPFTF